MAEIFIAEKANPDQELVYTPVKNKLLPPSWSKESDMLSLLQVLDCDILGINNNCPQLVRWTTQCKRQISLNEGKPMLISPSIISLLSLPWRLCRWAYCTRTQVSKKEANWFQQSRAFIHCILRSSSVTMPPRDVSYGTEISYTSYC